MTISIIDNEVYIQKVLTIWRNNQLKSGMIITDSNGIRRFDIHRARLHCKLIRLCNILWAELSMYGTDIYRHDRSTISDSKRLTLLLKEAASLHKDLEVKVPLEVIVNDFKSERNIKRFFGKIFRLYGMPLNESMLTAIFGKIPNPKKPTEQIDSISQFTAGTRFSSYLNGQFGTTVDMRGTGIFSIFFMRAAGLLELNGTAFHPIQEDDSKYFKDISPLWSENTVMRVFIRAALSTQIQRTVDE